MQSGHLGLEIQSNILEAEEIRPKLHGSIWGLERADPLLNLLSRIQICGPVGRSLPRSSVHGIPQAKKHWSGLLFPTPGHPSYPGIKPKSLAFPSLAGRLLTSVPPYYLFTLPLSST